MARRSGTRRRRTKATAAAMARLGNEGEEGAAHTLRQVEVGLVVLHICAVHRDSSSHAVEGGLCELS